MGIDALFLILLAIAIFGAAKIVQKHLRVLPIVFYLIVGVILGVGGLNIFNSQNFPSIDTYSTLALILMFLGAGFNIGGKKGDKESSGVVLKLATLPVYIEFVIMTAIIYLLINIIPIGLELSVLESLTISIIFSAASPANIIPVTMRHIAEGSVGNNDIAKDMTVAGALDNFTTMPVIVLALVLLIGSALNVTTSPTVLVLGSIVGMVILAIVSYFVGKLLAIILNPIGKKVKEGKFNITAYAMIYFIIIAIGIQLASTIEGIGGIIAVLGILIAAAAGAGIKAGEGNELSTEVQMELNKVFVMIGMPIVFVNLGAGIEFSMLTNIRLLAVCILIVVAAVAIKALVTKFVLKGKPYTDGDRKYAMSCFVPKGVTLVNFTIILSLLIKGTDMFRLMSILSVVAVIVTVPLGVTLMANKGAIWLKSNN